MLLKKGFICLLILIGFWANSSFGQGQDCTTLGQTPGTAFPVCGTTVFEQENVPICATNDLFVPGCDDGAAYANKNPFWYRFTCYTSGTLSFVITPKDPADDYDWQLYDVTGLDPNEVFTNHNIIISGNWAGNPGPTGANATGAAFIQCASTYTGTEPRFAKSPNILAGHEYILLVSHYSDSQSGYSLSFAGGTAVITDPTEPHMSKAFSNCDGKTITLRLNKKMRCSSISASGSEFSLVPAAATVISAASVNCSSSFDFDEVVITLSNPLPAGNYQLFINTGSDNNSLLDNCDRNIPPGEDVQFVHTVPLPIPIESIDNPGCAPSSIKLNFVKKINCSTISPDGSNFQINGPTPVTVKSASGLCTGGFSDVIVVTFNSPIYTKGVYTVIPRLSVNGGAVMDECGKIIQPDPVNFTTADTVSAQFHYQNALGCRNDTLTFSHNGAHDVNAWNWLFNNNTTVTTATHTVIWPASSSNSIRLAVSNGVCKDTADLSLVLDNEVKAAFEMPNVMCPEDELQLVNTSGGLVDTWKWTYVVGNSNLKTPDRIKFPATNIETFYTVKLVASNNTFQCSDSISKILKVFDNCFIAVPSAFTPNGDGRNDYLRPNNAIKASNLEFKIYNRWGQLVFQSKSWEDQWDGKLNGITQAAGVYVWFLRYTHADTGKMVFQKGTTTLIR
jgi:gliding motility-associated-like protein